MSTRYYRKVIRIRAEDSPNVQFALWQQRHGIVPTNDVITPGVLTWDEYQKRRTTWDRVRQCVGLDAEFWEGFEVRLFPTDWLNRAKAIAEGLRTVGRTAEGIGIDPGEGVADTSMAAVDSRGLIELVSRPTPDTSVVVGEAIAFMNRHKVAPQRVYFDRGGGGKQHADVLRAKGYKVQTVAFGEAPSLDIRRGLHLLDDRKEIQEERYAYRNRRAEMYGEMSLLMDPARGGAFGIPAEYQELLRQLSLMPRLYDSEGRMELPPKQKRNENDTRRTLVDIIGRSPDDADAVVLAVHAMQHKVSRPRVSAR